MTETQIDFEATFAALPGNFLVLKADAPYFTILAASDELMEENRLEKNELIGKSVFEAYKLIDNLLFQDASYELKRSLQHVCKDKVKDTVPLFPQHAMQTSTSFEERYFSVRHKPVIDQKGELSYIISAFIEKTNANKDKAEALHMKPVPERKLLQSLLDQAPVGMCMFVGEDFKIISANQIMCGIWGRSAEQVLNQPILECLPELRGQGFDDLLGGVLQSGKPYFGKEVPATLIRNGVMETNYYNFVYQPLYDELNKILGIVVVGYEVTELVMARKAVEEREKELQDLNQQLERRVKQRTEELELVHHKVELQWKELFHLFEQAPVAISVLSGPNYVIDIANQKICDLWGRPQLQALHTPLFDLLPEVAGQGFEELLDGVMATGEPFLANELPSNIKRHGVEETAYWNFVYHPFRDDQQVVKGVIIVATEVTEQVIARKKILESQEELKRFKFMADQAQDAFVLIRKDWTFAYLNKNALEFWGYTEEEAKHLKLVDIEPTFEEEEFAEIFKKAQTENVPPTETEHKRKDGKLIPVDVSAVGLNLDGEPYVFAIARDISEHKLSEQALQLKNQELIHINNDLDNFIYTASHDLRTPITNIEGLILVLQDTLSPEELQEPMVEQTINWMQESVIRFKKTIANLSDVVKLQKESKEEIVLVDLNTVIHNVLLDLEPMIKKAGVDLEMNLNQCKLIRFSEKNLRSVVYNLLSNAIKYRSPDRPSKIALNCNRQDGYNILSFQDNGIGMSKHSLDHLFRIFKRFHTKVEGTGIGLYMAKKLVVNAGGHITVESEEGIGSTFNVYLPV